MKRPRNASKAKERGPVEIIKGKTSSIPIYDAGGGRFIAAYYAEGKRRMVKYKSLEAAKTKVYQQHGAEPGWTFYPMAGTTFGAIGGQAMECLQLLPKLVPDKDKDYGEKLYRKAFVWWSVALQRGNSMVQLNGVYRGNVANRQELGQDQPRRRPDR